MARRVYRLQVGIVSWIHQQVNPFINPDFNVIKAVATPTWLQATYLGLVATKNNPPASDIDFLDKSNTTDHRSLLYSKINLFFDSANNNIDYTGARIEEELIDPGWTPVFNNTIVGVARLAALIPGALGGPHKGQQGQASSIVTDDSHPNTCIQIISPAEHIVANGLNVFRAGKETDDMGTSFKVGCPYHVPWVWCEWKVTIEGETIRIYFTGSAFPSHSLYINDSRVASINELTDPIFYYTTSLIPTFDLDKHNLYRVLKTGVQGKTQSADNTSGYVGTIDKMQYTVLRGNSLTFRLKLSDLEKVI